MQALGKGLVVLLLMSFAAIIGGAYVCGGYTMPTAAMEPTIPEGGIILVNRMSHRSSGVKRGQIVLVQVPGEDTQVVRRVVAFQHETVELRDGDVYVNGTKLEEPWRKPFKGDEPKVEIPTPEFFGPVTVGDNRIFVVGDFRKASNDSRTFGAVPVENILGTAWSLFGLTF